MLEELNRRFISAREQLREKQKLMNALKATEQQLTDEKFRFSELEISLKKEGRDVEKLEGLSLMGLFYTILGDKEHQLEKERQEYLAAKLRYDECKEAVTMLEQRCQDIILQIKELGEVETHYELIFDAKEKAIIEEKGIEAERLVKILEEIADVKSDVKELQEAISTGNKVLLGVNDVIESLRSASGWGTWDLLGGGLIATAIKHSRIDDARNSVHKVQQHLRIFLKELSDVNPALDSRVSVDIGGLTTFADYFFDGLIVDWIVQSRIEKSLENALDMGEKMVKTLKNLQETFKENQSRVQILEQERKTIVEVS